MPGTIGNRHRRVELEEKMLWPDSKGHATKVRAGVTCSPGKIGESRMSVAENYIVTLEEDENGDLIMPIPDEIMTAMDLHIGDELSFEDNGDGSFTLKPIRSAK